MKRNIEIGSNIETLFGTRDENLHVLEDGLNVTIHLRANGIEIEGAGKDVDRAAQVFADYAALQRSGFQFSNGDVGSMLRVVVSDATSTLGHPKSTATIRIVPARKIRAWHTCALS